VGIPVVPETRQEKLFLALKFRIELGIGLACVPNFAVRGQITSGSLVKVLDEHLEHSGTFRAMWPASQHTSPKLRAFVNHMAEHLFPKAHS
jgi:DNA-binding transcriptional LysR family regulator